MSLIIIVVCLAAVLWVFCHKWSDNVWINWTLKFVLGTVAIFAVILFLAFMSARRENHQHQEA